MGIIRRGKPDAAASPGIMPVFRQSTAGFSELVEFYKRSTHADITARLKRHITEGNGLGLTIWGEKKLDKDTREKVAAAAISLYSEFSESGNSKDAEKAAEIARKLLGPGIGEQYDIRAKAIEFGKALR